MNPAQAPIAEYVYLDHNATTPVRPEVRESMAPFLEAELGNPSSLHARGRSAREGIEQARKSVAAALGCSPAEVYFTAGGTESVNWALKGAAAVHRGAHCRIITTAIEHYAVLRVCSYLERQGVDVVRVPVEPSGIVDPDVVAAAVDERTILISVMHANNETGCVQPVAEIGEIAWRRGIPLHVDAVQSLGRETVRVDSLSADLVSVSAHKVNGPKGVGALFVRRGMALDPLLHGGGQERGQRSGTENVAGIVGFGHAVRLKLDRSGDADIQIRGLRDALETGICEGIPDVRLNGHRQRRLANTANLSFPGVSSESLVRALDRCGIAVASGSACATEESEPSHVLLAMGCDRACADAAVRFSLGWGNTRADIDHVLAVLPDLVAELRAAGSA